MKKNLLFMLLSSFVMLASCTNNDYNLGFKLGSTEEDIVEFVQANNLKCLYEDKIRSEKFVLRVTGFEYEDIKFGTIRLGFSNNQLCYIEHRIHNIDLFEDKDNTSLTMEYLKMKYGEDKDNISLTMEYLKKKYGEPKENLNYEDFDGGKYYWGEMKSRFMIIEPCSEDYIKVHIGDSSLDSEVAEIYRELLLN